MTFIGLVRSFAVKQNVLVVWNFSVHSDKKFKEQNIIAMGIEYMWILLQGIIYISAQKLNKKTKKLSKKLKVLAPSLSWL